MIKRKCIKCGNEFKAKAHNTRYCKDCHKSKCVICNKRFIASAKSIKRGAKFCSNRCWMKAKWEVEKCRVCGKKIKKNGKRIRYCSEKCYEKQFKIWDKIRTPEKNRKSKAKSWIKKKDLLLSLGGKCSGCGNSDLRVLEFSHIGEKNVRLKKREKMNPMTRWKIMADEIKKGRVVLECANCHRIRTHEEFWKNETIK